MDEEAADVFVHEGDTILLSYEVKGETSFLYSMQPIRRYARAQDLRNSASVYSAQSRLIYALYLSCFCSKDKDDEAYEALDKYAFNQPTLYPLAYDEVKKRAIPPNVHCKLYSLYSKMNKIKFINNNYITFN